MYFFLKKLNWISIIRYTLIPIIIGVFYLIFTYLYSDIKTKTRQNFNNEQLLVANTAAQGISTLLAKYQSELEFIVLHDYIKDVSNEGEKSLEYFYNTNKEVINAVTRVDANGNIIYTYPENNAVIGKNIADQKHVKKLLSTKKIVVSDVFKSVQGYYAIAIHVPILKNNKFYGSLAILIPINKLGELFLDKVGLDKKGHAWLITQNNTEIYCRIEGHEGKSLEKTTKNHPSTLSLINEIKLNESGSGKIAHQELENTSNNELQNLFVVFKRIPIANTHWTILISYQENEIYAALTNFRYRLLVILSLFFGLILVYVFSFARVRRIIREESKRKKAENLLKESEEKFKALFISAGDASLVIKDGVVIDCNKKAISLLERNKDELIGKKVWKLSPIHQENSELSEKKAYKIMAKAKNQAVIQFDWQYTSGNNKIIDVEITLSTIDKAKNLRFAILRDVTERKKAQKAFKESNERFISFIENTPMYAYIKDQSLNFVYRNKKFDSLITKKSSENNPFTILLNEPIRKMLENADKEILSGKKKNTELIYEANVNGKKLWFHELKFRITISDNTYAVGGAFFDITDVKKYEIELEKHKNNLEKLVTQRTKELETANKDLELLNTELKKQKKEVDDTLHELKETQSQLIHSEKMASLGILTAGVAHELNNPLNYISGSYSVIKKQLDENGSIETSTLNKYLDWIHEGTKRATNIVKSLNLFSRNTNDSKEECDIHKIIDDCLVMLQNKYKNRIEIEKKYSKATLLIDGNIGKLLQVFLNLISNAIDATTDEGKITITTTLRNKTIKIVIKDNGSGIPKEKLKHVIDPFYTTKPPGKGVGLGLSISNSIIEEHQGSLTLNSKQNIGTTVTVTFSSKN